jgi:mannose-6-phosphate isomerase-like protein (cupin superfamily)
VSEPTVIAPGGGEVIGDAPDRRVEILAEHDTLHATWSRFGPGRDGADLHVHRRHSDLFYVLDGELTVRLGRAGDEVVAPAGTLVRVPPLVVHGFRNRSAAEVRYLNLHAPGPGFATYLRALREGRTLVYDQEPPPADGGRPPSEAVLTGDGSTRDRYPAMLADTEAIAVVEAWGEPEAAQPPRASDGYVTSYYVLEGELAIAAGDRVLPAPAGAWAQVPPGVAYTLSFPGRTRYLEVRTPNPPAG